MAELKKEYRDNSIVEKGLLAHLLRRSEREITNIIGAMLRREDFESPINGRLFAALKMWSIDETECLASELHDMFLYCKDDEAIKALIDISCAPYPESTSELVLVALHIRDQAAFRENVRLEEEARGLWLGEECERGDVPDAEPDEGLEW